MSKKNKTAESYIKDVKRRTRRKFSTEEKIRIVIEGLRGEYSVDLQSSRSSASQVASGLGAAIIGGADNMASGDMSFVGAGEKKSAIGTESFVGAGDNNTTSGSESFIGAGDNNTADGNKSFVGAGDNNTADGNKSFVGAGDNNMAEGRKSLIGSGDNNTADGNFSSILGSDNIASSRSEVVVGQFNEDLAGDPENFIVDDPIFIVGNGSNNSNRSNALVIEKSGEVGIGTNNPQNELHIEGNIRMVDGNEAVGKVLTSDGDGVATWQENAGNTSVFAIKTADQVATDDATLVFDNDFSFVLEANSTYRIEGSIEFEGGDAEAKVQWNYAGGTINSLIYGFPRLNVSGGNINGLGVPNEIPVNNNHRTDKLFGIISTDTAGTLTFMFAPFNDMGDTATLTVKANSFMILTNLN